VARIRNDAWRANARFHVIGLAERTTEDPMKAITLKLPETLDHRLTHFTRQPRASSNSAAVRHAMEAYVDAAPQAAHCAVLATNWLGMLRGPADLSTHPRQLDNFGA